MKAGSGMGRRSSTKGHVFKGVSAIKLDANGRFAIPSKHREKLREMGVARLVITVDRDGCLLIYPESEWEKIEEQLLALPSMNKQARFVQRLLLGHASECELDAQGRVLLPGELREVARLKKDAVLIGQGRKFELWDRRLWSARRDDWIEQDGGTQFVNEVLEAVRI